MIKAIITIVVVGLLIVAMIIMLFAGTCKNKNGEE